jgi:hypothetical protein
MTRNILRSISLVMRGGDFRTWQILLQKSVEPYVEP